MSETCCQCSPDFLLLQVFKFTSEFIAQEKANIYFMQTGMSSTFNRFPRPDWILCISFLVLILDIFFSTRSGKVLPTLLLLEILCGYFDVKLDSRCSPTSKKKKNPARIKDRV